MTIKEVNRELHSQNVLWGHAMRQVPRACWPQDAKTPAPIAVWRSYAFLVQIYEAAGGVIRLSIIRTKLGDDGRWVDGITWEEMQLIKGAVGYRDRYAVEVFPAEADVVNVANMRHLWVLPEPLPFAWRTDTTLSGGKP